MPPRSFSTPAAFRAWLRRHHATVSELFVRRFRIHAHVHGITYAEALDEALCHGWIDGVRRAFDADSFTVRFTPRRPKSIWSAVNLRRARELEAAGRMRPPGLAAFRARTEDRSRRYSFESKPVTLAPAYARTLRARRRAFAYFSAQPPWYRRTCAFWVMSARREETRKRRLALLIECSERGTPVPPLARPAAGKRPGPSRRPRVGS